MKVQDLDFPYPESLVAIQPQSPPRVMWVEAGQPSEIPWAEVLNRIPAGDALVLNETKVLKRRVFAGDVEILFLDRSALNPREWKVLFPSRKMKVGETLELPGGVVMTLLEKGRPQRVETDRILTEEDFDAFGELPLPPYIQKARGERHNRELDRGWYQTAWAKEPGSFAAPTASLHFREEDLAVLVSRGVRLFKVTLHVGLGTFLPVTTEDLNDHVMHSEWAEIPVETGKGLADVRAKGGKVWALGTTVARTLESAAAGKLELGPGGELRGWTDLLIQPGYAWKSVDRLLTNFHQPQSTLLALVSAFATLPEVKAAYAWAIERKFRLFSYGDLSIWIRSQS
ncbi:MAG: tRNA preQ1(34) S-adenosylmethionine ribosyltransferase-isomerase QueA [Bdellovibrionaceae bacterium]|nr:tRNA preQ1(34) S-adenosylmethionine ribosyltransferase-isomerase QueA [Pseudobdellovibrionaceae bacterium]